MSDQILRAESADEKGRRVSEEAAPAPLVSVALDPRHRVAEFICKNSDRVQLFLRRDAEKYGRYPYCYTFVLEDPEDPNHVWGYYTLAAATILWEDMSGNQQKRVPGHLPVPVARIGFMGRDDTSPKETGLGLLLDAARRVSRNKELAAWGIVLEPKADREKLVKWYEAAGFQWCRVAKSSMYAPLRRLMGDSK